MSSDSDVSYPYPHAIDRQRYETYVNTCPSWRQTYGRSIESEGQKDLIDESKFRVTIYSHQTPNSVTWDTPQQRDNLYGYTDLSANLSACPYQKMDDSSSGSLYCAPEFYPSMTRQQPHDEYNVAPGQADKIYFDDFDVFHPNDILALEAPIPRNGQEDEGRQRQEDSIAREHSSEEGPNDYIVTCLDPSPKVGHRRSSVEGSKFKSNTMYRAIPGP